MEQVIEIGPMSGKSNVIFWLERKGLATDDETVDRIFQRAKQSNRTLLDSEIIECLPSAKRPTVANAD
jgi:2-isopropylmalate synthase